MFALEGKFEKCTPRFIFLYYLDLFFCNIWIYFFVSWGENPRIFLATNTRKKTKTNMSDYLFY